MSAEHLDGHHRATVEKIFTHPTGHNIQWHDVISLLEQVGTVEETHKGHFRVTLGDESVVLERPKHADLTTQQVIDVRHLLEHAEVTPATTGS
jgi:hypothetical protein